VAKGVERANKDETVINSAVRSRSLAAASADVAAPRRALGFRQRLLRDNRARVSLAVVGAAIVLAIFAPLFAPYDPNEPNFMAIRQEPSRDHLFGTDSVGRDLLSRAIFGSRVSLGVAAVAVLISGTIGILVGSLSGFFGGWVDAILQRITEIFIAFPSLLLIITVATAIGPSLRNAMIIIGVFGWVGLSRLIRVEVLSLKEQEFITAARTVGSSTPRLILRHLLPNASGPIVVNLVFGLRAAILAEAGLSFLGVGVPPPTASWGNMINIANSITYLQSMPYAWIPPTVMLIVVVVAFSFLGDSIVRTMRR
jgi:peptide/nickel transport system permease protein